MIFTKINVNTAAIQDLSGFYNFTNCACTVLRCLEPSFYEINQNQNGDLAVTYLYTTLVARGKATLVNNGQQTQVSLQWSQTDFYTNCTGTWIPTKRTIDLKCGDQFRYCTGQLQCRGNSGACAKNNSMTLNIHYVSSFWKMIISTIFLLLIKNINS
ncbi:unnamed protein product [Adineta steineri]|uniref:Uncharacterized protein n=1 Tax=Adineta steineri TaxID=433720 RepID=A0A815RZG3_9BILA|nr:unnamed protein product [Adineta steineri]CAF1482300.1 unnamed protein product [Adineta steineri]